jgi:hypothetical protein
VQAWEGHAEATVFCDHTYRKKCFASRRTFKNFAYGKLPYPRLSIHRACDDGPTNFPTGLSHSFATPNPLPPTGLSRAATTTAPLSSGKSTPPQRMRLATAIAERGINFALLDRRRYEQVHSAQDRCRRSDCEGPRQGNPSQDPGSKPDSGGYLGDE